MFDSFTIFCLVAVAALIGLLLLVIRFGPAGDKIPASMNPYNKPKSEWPQS